MTRVNYDIPDAFRCCSLGSSGLFLSVMHPGNSLASLKSLQSAAMVGKLSCVSYGCQFMNRLPSIFNILSLFFRFFLDNSYTSRTWCSRSGSCRFFFLINLSVHNLIEVIYFLTCLYNMLTVHRVLRPDTNLADSSFSCVGRYALIAFRKINLNQIPKIIPKIPVSSLH